MSDVLYERIIMDAPEQYAIWIGPAQQADARNPCYANPCSLCWPLLPGAPCTGALTGQYERITLRDVHIYSPQQSPGVVLGSPLLPMLGVTFDSVIVHPECGAASRLSGDDFRASFARLPQSAVPADPYVSAFYGLLACSVLLLLLLPWLASTAGRFACVRRAAPTCTRLRSTGCSVTLACVAVLAARLALINVRLGDTTSFYVCEGVEHGVASGDTWPVPSCFADRTHRRRGGDGGGIHHHPCRGAGFRAPEVIRAVALSALALLGLFACSCRSQRFSLARAHHSFASVPSSASIA